MKLGPFGDQFPPQIKITRSWGLYFYKGVTAKVSLRLSREHYGVVVAVHVLGQQHPYKMFMHEFQYYLTQGWFEVYTDGEIPDQGDPDQQLKNQHDEIVDLRTKLNKLEQDLLRSERYKTELTGNLGRLYANLEKLDV
jgi:hypothetical protein